jgi:disulfide bond formation protein DsbB
MAALGVAGSAATLGAGFFFQHVIGLVPCELCIWQRWPHVAAVVLGGLALALGRRLALALAAAALVAGAGIAAYHVGVEQHWWQGPTTCGAPDFGTLTPQQMLEALRAAPIVRCDEIPWSLFGISMAGYNALLSAGLAGLFALAYASSSASQYR